MRNSDLIRDLYAFPQYNMNTNNDFRRKMRPKFAAFSPEKKNQNANIWLNWNLQRRISRRRWTNCKKLHQIAKSHPKITLKEVSVRSYFLNLFFFMKNQFVHSFASSNFSFSHFICFLHIFTCQNHQSKFAKKRYCLQTTFDLHWARCLKSLFLRSFGGC